MHARHLAPVSKELLPRHCVEAASVPRRPIVWAVRRLCAATAEKQTRNGGMSLATPPAAVSRHGTRLPGDGRLAARRGLWLPWPNVARCAPCGGVAWPPTWGGVCRPPEGGDPDPQKNVSSLAGVTPGRLLTFVGIHQQAPTVSAGGTLAMAARTCPRGKRTWALLNMSKLPIAVTKVCFKWSL